MVEELIPNLFNLAVFVGAPALVLFILYSMQKNAKTQMRAAAAQLGLTYSDGDGAPASGGATAAGAAAQTDPLKRLSGEVGGGGGILSFFAPWRVEGDYQGRRVLIEPIMRGHGKSRHRYTRVTVFYRKALGLALEIGPEGFFSKIASAVSLKQDIQLGDAKIDKELTIAGNNEAAVRSVLAGSAIRTALVSLVTDYAHAGALDDRAVAELRGVVSEEAKLRAMLDACRRVADALEGDSRF